MSLPARIKALIQRHLPRHSFVRSVGVLAGGTALAQGIGLLALPLITRLYTPHDFSILAVFSSIVAIASVPICLRFDIAIPLPEKDEDAANLFALSVCFCTLLSALCFLVILVFSDKLIEIINQPALQPYVWLLPLGIWLSGIYSAIQFWATRKKRFSAIAKTRLSQIISSTITQIALGISGILGGAGLLIGQIISSSAGFLGLGRFAWKQDQALRDSISKKSMGRLLKDYSRFPKYSTFEALANIAAIQFPIIIIGAVATGPEAGYLLLAMKAAAIPMGLIGAAISQVYLSHAPLEHRELRLAGFTVGILSKLVRIGWGPLLFIGITSPVVIPLIFGKEWHRAGVMIAWMTPCFLLQLLVSPISMALHIVGHQGLAMMNQFFGFALRVGFTVFAANMATNLIFEYYAISGILVYGIYFAVVSYAIKIRPNEFLKEIRFSAVHCIPWVLFGSTFFVVGNFFLA
ncbi:oligosaccharide flippase family protein [Tepidiphilus baoligensis]|uniref:Oligosaccharide flippase family protein n=1 Tax=Tepidiphilus baoligensis TaxID=2698687 RepID=A0ABX1QN97_9PROT|nr:oligosaccharide flippase family protein [Tepidiphilus baoligensis]NMH17357.1 oligosaccharide flippase family protein [Tepidiphilus baoligensis]